jgi:hypothetical protein
MAKVPGDDNGQMYFVSRVTYFSTYPIAEHARYLEASDSLNSAPD